MKVHSVHSNVSSGAIMLLIVKILDHFLIRFFNFLSSRIDEICQPTSSSGFGKSSWDNDLNANQKGKSSAAASSSAKWNDDFEKEKYGILVSVPDPFELPIPGSG
jgi:hypothetical protein